MTVKGCCDEEFTPVDEIMDGEQVFQVLARLVGGPGTAVEVASSSGLEPPVVAAALELLSGEGLVKASGKAFAIDWKALAAMFVDEAVGMSTEIAVMREEFRGPAKVSFETFSKRAEKRVDGFKKALYGDPGFVDLVREYLTVLVNETLVDDPALYDVTLGDTAANFENLLVKAGPQAFGRGSGRNAKLASSLRDWSRHACMRSMPGEIALAEILEARGILRTR